MRWALLMINMMAGLAHNGVKFVGRKICRAKEKKRAYPWFRVVWIQEMGHADGYKRLASDGLDSSSGW